MKSLSKGMLTLKANSAVPSTTATGADLNAGVRYETSGDRNPALATPPDKVQEKLAGEQCCCICIVGIRSIGQISGHTDLL